MCAEAINRLDQVKEVAHQISPKKNPLSYSDIIEKLILTHTRNSLAVIEDQIREHAVEINRLQELKRDLQDKATQTRIVIPKEIIKEIE